MDGDVQQHYLAAEQAYGDGDFAQAEAIASTLLRELDGQSDTETEQEARLAWRAFVALLLGHIHFHGLNQPGPALEHYRLVLASQPPQTLHDLANQGVERCEASLHPAPLDVETPAPPEGNKRSLERTQPATVLTDNSATPNPDNSLIRDPFLGTTMTLSSQPCPSAAPWLGEGSTVGTAEMPSQQPESHPITGGATSADAKVAKEAQGFKATTESVIGLEANHAPPEITDDAPEEQPLDAPMAATPPLDLSPWLLRRTLP